MKIAHINENNKLLGWYDSSIHRTIPTPNIQVTEEQWQLAINNEHNKVNSDGSTESYDFRTQEEIELELKQAISNAVQNMLDSKAQELRYDNINSIAKYLGYDNAFRTECEQLGEWAANCWVKAGELEDSGNSYTVETVLAEMPSYEG